MPGTPCKACKNTWKCCRGIAHALVAEVGQVSGTMSVDLARFGRGVVSAGDAKLCGGLCDGLYPVPGRLGALRCTVSCSRSRSSPGRRGVLDHGIRGLDPCGMDVLCGHARPPGGLSEVHRLHLVDIPGWLHGSCRVTVQIGYTSGLTRSAASNKLFHKCESDAGNKYACGLTVQRGRPSAGRRLGQRMRKPVPSACKDAGFARYSGRVTVCKKI